MSRPTRARPVRPCALRAPLVPLLLLWLAVSSACAAPPPSPADDGAGATSGATPLPVWVSLPPQAWLMEAVGGERVEVEVLLPPGASPHTYEPSPRQVVALDRASLYLAVGHPHLIFERRLREKVLTGRGDLPILDLWSLRGAEEPPPDLDPHLWLDPRVMARAAESLAEALGDLDPEHRDAYRRRLVRTRERIGELDRRLAERLEHLPRRRFWVDHPAWGWFARRYGLEQVALEEEGKEMSAARLVELTDRARRQGVEVIFVQKGSSHRAARAFAGSVGARVRELDPLARDWQAELERTAELLAEALGSDGGRARSAVHSGP